MAFRFLCAGDLPRMHAAFLQAFADYPGEFCPSEEDLRRLMVRRGVRYDVSVGAFDGDELVGLMAVALGRCGGRSTAYDAFTGVIPDYRGRGIAGALFEQARPRLVELGVERFRLEVIQTNEAALRAYRRVGFETVRELVCSELPRSRVRLRGPAFGAAVRRVVTPEWERWSAFRDWEPSWQNSAASVDRTVEDTILLEATVDGTGVGYAVVVPSTGDLPQLAVAAKHRRRGIGSHLLAAALGSLEREASMRIINVDASATADLEFFSNHGALPTVRQFEMQCVL